MITTPWTDINTVPDHVLLYIITRLRGPEAGPEPLPQWDNAWGWMTADTVPHAGIAAAAEGELSTLASLRRTSWRLYRLIDDNRDAIVAAFTRRAVRGQVTQWFFCHVFHRDGAPAIVHDKDSSDDTDTNAEARWYHMGVCHRGDDLPAVDTANAMKWYVAGQLHRDGGRVAVIGPRRAEYWVRGRLHRDTLPAEYSLLGWRWFTHGLCGRPDRPDAPARIHSYSVSITDSYVYTHTSWDEDPTDVGYSLYNNGDADLMWYRDGLLHRDGDLPAVMMNYGALGWFTRGLLHRDGDLPAIVDGAWREWWVDGKRHRAGGKPAVEMTEGVWYFEHGVEVGHSVVMNGIHRITALDTHDSIVDEEIPRRVTWWMRVAAQ